ncbi:HD domain-containing protein [bacterium]|nr:HD domain-containing protein [bacterium]
MENILTRLKEAGYEAFLVGGCVRDALLGIPCEDFDIATSARPKDIKKLFPKCRAVGQAFAVMLVDGLEVATFRNDGTYSDYRHPDSITYADSIEEDLSRRDFTVNAMAYDGEKIIDPYDGRSDLENRIIRFVRNARERMREDPLRALRACRFAAKIDGKLEPKTRKAIKDLGHLIDMVSVERRQQELTKMLLGKNPDLALRLVGELGLLPYLFLDLVPSIGCTQPPHHLEDCWEHALQTLKSAKRIDLPLRLACLLHDIAKPACRKEVEKDRFIFYNHDILGEKMVRKALTDLRFSNETIDKVSEYTRYHMRPLLYSFHMKDPALQRLIGALRYITIRDLIRFMLCDVRGNMTNKGKGFSFTLELARPVMRRIRRIEKEKRVLHIKDLPVNGNDLMKELGIPPGPEVGKLLAKLYSLALQKPKLATREKLLSEAKKLLLKQ